VQYDIIDYCTTQQEDIIYTHKKVNDFLKAVTASKLWNYANQTLHSDGLKTHMNLPLYGHVPLTVFKNLKPT